MACFVDIMQLVTRFCAVIRILSNKIFNCSSWIGLVFLVSPQQNIFAEVQWNTKEKGKCNPILVGSTYRSRSWFRFLCSGPENSSPVAACLPTYQTFLAERGNTYQFASKKLDENHNTVTNIWGNCLIEVFIYRTLFVYRIVPHVTFLCRLC